MVIPRINAASRMDSPMRAYELLATNNEGEAGALADHLSKINDERKLMVTNIMREVRKNLEKKEIEEIASDVMVVGNPSWKVGVLGLVAGKLSEEYKRPVFVWGKDENDFIKGSCRSDGSVSVVELMTEAKESFLEFGGHEMAGGFTVHTDKIHFLEKSLSESYGKLKKEIGESDSSLADIEGGLDLVKIKNWKEIEKLAPFGLANPKPIFLFKSVKIDALKKFGKNGSGEHLEIVFSDGGRNRAKAIAFFCNEDSFKAKISEGSSVNLLANFDLSRFRGREELRLRIIDIYPS